MVGERLHRERCEHLQRRQVLFFERAGLVGERTEGAEVSLLRLERRARVTANIRSFCDEGALIEATVRQRILDKQRLAMRDDMSAERVFVACLRDAAWLDPDPYTRPSTIRVDKR